MDKILKIEKFSLYNSTFRGQDISTEKSLSLEESLPDTLEWTYNNEVHKMICENRILATITLKKDKIAIIKSPFDPNLNNAFIIDGIGLEVWNVYDLAKKKLINRIRTEEIIFTDVYYIGTELYFFIFADGYDFRFSFNTVSGEMGKFIESR